MENLADNTAIEYCFRKIREKKMEEKIGRVKVDEYKLFIEDTAHF
jgi:hypothetical protein